MVTELCRACDRPAPEGRYYCDEWCAYTGLYKRMREGRTWEDARKTRGRDA